MGIGKHGMSLSEARAAADGLEWSPSKTQGSSKLSTGARHTRTPKQSASMSGKSAAHMTHGKATSPHGTKGGGGGHHRDYKVAHHG